MLDHADDVGGMAAAGAFGVVGVDCAVLEGCDGGFDEAGFVERVRVDEALDVVLVAYGETGVDGSRCGSPVLVKFQATGAGFALFSQCDRRGVVAFACDTEIEWKRVDCL